MHAIAALTTTASGKMKACVRVFPTFAIYDPLTRAEVLFHAQGALNALSSLVARGEIRHLPKYIALAENQTEAIRILIDAAKADAVLSVRPDMFGRDPERLDAAISDWILELRRLHREAVQAWAGYRGIDAARMHLALALGDDIGDLFTIVDPDELLAALARRGRTSSDDGETTE